MRRTSLAALTLSLALVAPGAAAIPLDVGHVAWVEPGDAWVSAGGLVRANADAVPDVVRAAGDRSASYIQCGNGPWTSLHRAQDLASPPVPRIEVLDGVTGSVLWRADWNTGGVGAERESFELLEGVHTGDLDGDGSDDVLVLRSSYAVDGSTVTVRATMYAAATGAIRWETVETVARSAAPIRAFIPFEVFGEPGGLMLDVRINPDLSFESSSTLVSLSPDAAPEVVLALPEQDGLALPTPVAYGDGIRLITEVVTITFPPPTVSIDMHAMDVTRDEDGELVTEIAWERSNVGGNPVLVTGGEDPAIVTGDDGVVALDLDTGATRWTHPADVSPEGGTLAIADANGDGVDDVIASPAFGPEHTGLFAGGFFGEMIAIDGRNGQELWRQEDATGKFRAWAIQTADLEGDGAAELVASLAQQDGFPVCSTPTDDPGAVAVYDLATGAKECHLPTDRFPSAVAAANVDGSPGDELLASTYGGSTYAFTDAEPGCGALAVDPLR